VIGALKRGLMPDTLAAIRRLDMQARALEARASGPDFETYISSERAKSESLGGRTVAQLA